VSHGDAIRPGPAVRHHDLCFGCGQANLFGLQLEAEETEDGVRGRFFVKQDHQGPHGVAHAGILVTALAEAMSLAGGDVTEIHVDLRAPAPVGEFVEIEATASRATARRGEEVVAECRT
jgi:acyl-coenzyme A thioesterase PaaI-like protein